MNLCPSVFQQLLKETLAPIPTMLPTAADIKREILERLRREAGPDDWIGVFTKRPMTPAELSDLKRKLGHE